MPDAEIILYLKIMKKFLVLAALALVACSKNKATVAIDKSSDENLPMDITIDDTLKIHLVSDSSFNVILTEGEHVLKSKNLTKTFEVKEGGGIINLDNAEYVIYGIEYSSSKLGLGGMKRETPILIDSFIVFKNQEVFGKKIPMSDKKLVEMLPKIEQNVSGKDGKQTAKFTKVGKDQFYIDKFWDYNLNDEIPETIEVKGISGSKTKYAAMRANYFLLSLYLGNDEYSARTIADVKAGLHDKELEMGTEMSPDSLQEVN